MRIIAGNARGRTFDAPTGMDTRPTLDRVRENVFNILQMRVRGAKVLDLFSGSGAMAFEAISRGANAAVLVDSAREAHAVQLQNALKLALGNLPRSLAMAAVWAAWAVFLWYIHGIALLVYVIYGLSIPTGACTLLYDPIFRGLEPDEEEEEESGNQR